MALRSNARSIRASVTTGYCGAIRSMVASIVSRCETTAATRERASEAATGLPSISARWRSRIASAVRCPNSASKTAARASRRPVLRARIRSEPAPRLSVTLLSEVEGGAPPTPFARGFRSEPLSASDTVDRDGHGLEPQPEHPLDGRGDRGTNVPGERQEGVTRSGDQPDTDPDAPVRHLGRDRGAGKERTPGGPPPTDPGDAWNLERGESDHLGDDALADAQLRAAHEADSRVGAGSSVGAGPSIGALSGGGAVVAPAGGANASPMSSGTLVRAIVAATPTP